MASSKTRLAIKEILHPIRRSDLEPRRRALRLSRAALGRILDVDPATVFRQERMLSRAAILAAADRAEARSKLQNG